MWDYGVNRNELFLDNNDHSRDVDIRDQTFIYLACRLLASSSTDTKISSIRPHRGTICNHSPRITHAKRDTKYLPLKSTPTSRDYCNPSRVENKKYRLDNSRRDGRIIRLAVFALNTDVISISSVISNGCALHFS